MADPVEIVDDVTQFLSLPPLPIPPVPAGIQLVFRVTKKYVPGTVRIYVNGLLQAIDCLHELDPVERLVGVAADVPIDSNVEGDSSLHAAYLTFDPIAFNPDAPIHISQVVLGDVLRIAMRPGRHLEPVVSRRGMQHRLLARTRSRAAKNVSRTTILGLVTNNDRQLGVLSLQVSDPSHAYRNSLAAQVAYKDIQHIQKFITPAKEPRPVAVGGGPRARRTPGTLAKGVLGFNAFPGYARFIQVRF